MREEIAYDALARLGSPRATHAQRPRAARARGWLTQRARVCPRATGDRPALRPDRSLHQIRSRSAERGEPPASRQRQRGRERVPAGVGPGRPQAVQTVRVRQEVLRARQPPWRVQRARQAAHLSRNGQVRSRAARARARARSRPRRARAPPPPPPRSDAPPLTRARRPPAPGTGLAARRRRRGIGTRSWRSRGAASARTPT